MSDDPNIQTKLDTIKENISQYEPKLYDKLHEPNVCADALEIPKLDYDLKSLNENKTFDEEVD